MFLSRIVIARYSITGICPSKMNGYINCHQPRRQMGCVLGIARFVSVGNKGHINSDSRLGEWEEGLALLRELELMASSNQYRYAI